MAIDDVHLISKRGSAPPTTVSLDVRSVAANLYDIDRPLKKAGRPELKPFFGSDGETWLKPGDVVSAFESAREFFNDDSLDEILYEVVAEQLGPAIDVLRALPKDAVIRLEVVKSKLRKPAKPKPTRTRSSALAAAQAAGAVVPGMAKISLKLTAKQREYVQLLLEDYRCDADLWAFPDIERKSRLSEIDRYSGLILCPVYNETCVGRGAAFLTRRPLKGLEGRPTCRPSVSLAPACGIFTWNACGETCGSNNLDSTTKNAKRWLKRVSSPPTFSNGGWQDESPSTC